MIRRICGMLAWFGCLISLGCSANSNVKVRDASLIVDEDDDEAFTPFLSEPPSPESVSPTTSLLRASRRMSPAMMSSSAPPSLMPNWLAQGRSGIARHAADALDESSWDDFSETHRSDSRLNDFQELSVRERTETLRVAAGDGKFCAAVAITPRLAVTALHCVRAFCESPGGTPRDPIGCRVRYERADGLSAAGTVVSTNDTDHIALIDLHRVQPRYGSLVCDNPRAFDPVYIVSHPDGENWKLSYGRLARDPIALEWMKGKTTRVLVAEVLTKHGSSGGGLFDVRDRLVGIQIARWAPGTTDFGKAAFVQASQVYALAGQYCTRSHSEACGGLSCQTKRDSLSDDLLR
ncbi:MAG: serine protease [Polyangiaceae bacterium]